MLLEDDYQSLIKKAFQPLSLNGEEFDYFFSLWKEVQFERNAFITQAGNIESGFYVVVRGVQTIYIIDNKGNKKVIGFSFDGSYSGVYDSFMSETPSAYFLEALTPSTLLKISHTDFIQLFDRFPAFERWGRITHMELLIGRVNREVELITLSAKERFDLFMKRCPAPLRKIPQKYLASYLNMSPETFSRLRKG